MDQPLPEIDKLPKNVIKYYEITLLGQPFSEIEVDKGKIIIKRGYIYEGIKYYEPTPV